ncbi:uncharacterized oxidoreductase [Filimonas lacunae]|uniref:Uncharacterized oxidoreductase n=1 Tax=Filimonas lacunae TaxID=477680 RepID=A0A173MFE1_9BACT|nr:SDR family NAD(P)-dependent oxidoreductase [Filimonas lacunae]BAV06206.1 dehydrogenase protein DltE [Filimonas lacunae]SIT25267.1 uncharacterized oxidoreductase [Filimonas lacunae]
MNTTNNTVLITGGSAGIGLELAKLFSENGNRVIITGRTAATLQQAAAGLKNVTGITCDVTNANDVEKLVQQLKTGFPDLNIVINNAGQAYVYNLVEDADAHVKAEAEMVTNYFSIIRLNNLLLPLLKQQPEAAIVTVSSIVAFAPSALALPTYSASKAALHSYTQSLRVLLERTSNVKVFELMPPLVDTAFSKEIGGDKNGIPPQQVATEFWEALGKDTFEIHVGGTAGLYQLYLQSPEQAIQAMNAARETA